MKIKCYVKTEQHKTNPFHKIVSWYYTCTDKHGNEHLVHTRDSQVLEVHYVMVSTFVAGLKAFKDVIANSLKDIDL